MSDYWNRWRTQSQTQHTCARFTRFIYLYTRFECVYNKKSSTAAGPRTLSLAVFYICAPACALCLQSFVLEISFARVLLGALGALGALDVAAPVELAAALPVLGVLVRVVAPAAAQHLATVSPC
jgi:hypothetical protein